MHGVFDGEIGGAGLEAITDGRSIASVTEILAAADLEHLDASRLDLLEEPPISAPSPLPSDSTIDCFVIVRQRAGQLGSVA